MHFEVMSANMLNNKQYHIEKVIMPDGIDIKFLTRCVEMTSQP